MIYLYLSQQLWTIFLMYGGYAASSFKLAELDEKYIYFTSTRFRCLKKGKHFGKKESNG